MASTLTEEQFWCSICLSIFKNPVSIPCGHNYCLGCIKRFWDMRTKYLCPICNEAFKVRPDLRVNMVLKDITEQFKRSLNNEPNYKPPPPKRGISKQPSKSDGVSCDLCQDAASAAVKSCLVCRQSYCAIHLTPHLRDQVKTKHMLTDPGTFVTSHLCQIHKRLLEKFCKKDRKAVCMKCIETEHKHHEVVPMENESTKIRFEIKKKEKDFQDMIQARIRKAQEIKASMDFSKKDKDREIQTGAEVITMLKRAVEAHQVLLTQEVEQEHKAVERRSDKLLKELQEETDELQRRHSELQNLKDSEDPLHLIQSFPSVSAPLSTRDWSCVNIQTDNYLGTSRMVFSSLAKLCHKLENQLSAEEVTRINKYAVDVTLDPDTAAAWLVLSPDGKKVSLGCQQWKVNITNDPRRFDSCAGILGKQSFTARRHYWTVQVGDKTDWDLGVARESINKKGPITLRPDSGYWAICRRKGGSLIACAGPSFNLQLQETPKTVGVFLDYEKGSVSFYNTEAKTHIYTYTGCSFTEPLYPYFNPCLHDNGKNTAPLIICPVETMMSAF